MNNQYFKLINNLDTLGLIEIKNSFGFIPFFSAYEPLSTEQILTIFKHLSKIKSKTGKDYNPSLLMTCFSPLLQLQPVCRYSNRRLYTFCEVLYIRRI